MWVSHFLPTGFWIHDMEKSTNIICKGTNRLEDKLATDKQHILTYLYALACSCLTIMLVSHIR
ncbi:hypothetical protein CDL12_11697 [Handroanthus impetiginosus]|uniref:Uncharacterized protein n=1 Tax=Handroanthus impetiginosus TaxID=429701 RepID=A0A2G9HDQ6_9LAMI|nr:hypothetical protein CDL12_11697 [Handroanthus impetiginosus]